MPTLLRCAAALLLGAVSAVHATPPRDRVDGVAVAIEANYFDPERGRAIADDLRREAAAGTFDALADPVRLADRLTARLRPLDRHFAVRVAMTPADAGPGARARPRREPAPNHGIVASEVKPHDVGYLRLVEFAHFDPADERAPQRRAIDAALARLAKTRVVIVDLRGNRGGSPSMVGYLASAFVAPDADIYNRFRTRTQTFSEAPQRPYATPRVDVPLYVLVDAGTASAAESFAYTLQGARRATVIGQRSAGAANPGREFDAGHGLMVFVSDGSPINPATGRNWEGTGVVPDIEAPSQLALDVALTRASGVR